MSHELIYTSAQQGLKPGAYGFCTVAATEGMPKLLQDRLESLSGYEHAFGLTDRQAQLNPVNFSHLIVQVANQRLHLLSRIADAGADYTGRSNKLAHHVVLQPSELTAAGPAASLATEGFCQTRFEGPPRWLLQGVLPSSKAHPLQVCTGWQSVCGDAGWAGVLVELTLKHPGKPVTLIYGLGCDVLALVVEAISLLPPERQWHTTFSTYFTRLPAGIECDWRFVLDGTAAADQARRNLQSPPIELTKPGQVPFVTPLVAAARTGQLVVDSAESSPDSTTQKPLASGDATASLIFRGATAETRQSSNSSVQPSSGSSFGAGDDPFAKKKISNVVLASAIAGCLMLLSVVVGIGIYVAGGSGPRSSAVTKVEQKPKVTVEDIEKPAFLDSTRVQPNQTAKPVTIEPMTTVPQPKPVEAPTSVAPAPEIKLSDAEIQAAIVKDIEARNRNLYLPKREQSLGASDDHRELCKIYVKRPGDCDLSLVTTETIEDGQPRLFLARVDSTDDESQAWAVMTRHKNTTTQIIDETQIGMFTLKGQSLEFDWTAAPDWTSPFGLLYCKLDIQVGSKRLRCGLSKPTIQPVQRLNLSHRKSTLPIEISAHSLISSRNLYYDIELRLGDWKQSKGHISAAERQFLKFEIPPGPDAPNTQVDLELRIEPSSENHEATFAYRQFVYPTYLKAVDGPRWERITRRNDLIDEKSVDGFSISHDLDRYRNMAIDGRKKAISELGRTVAVQRSAQLDLDEANMKLAEASSNGNNDALVRFQGERDRLMAKLRELKALDAYCREAIDFADTTSAWGDAIRDRFKKIEQNLEVRFTIYLEYPGVSGIDQMVLVETDPAPSIRRSAK